MIYGINKAYGEFAPEFAMLKIIEIFMWFMLLINSEINGRIIVIIVLINIIKVLFMEVNHDAKRRK